MNKTRRLLIFCISMLTAFVFWRLIVVLKKGEISFLREITGLNFHHYTYGILIIFIASLIFIFHKPEKYSIALMGFGLGSSFDGLISRLFSESIRTIEIINYNKAFTPTIFLFIILIMVSWFFYFIFKNPFKTT